MRTSPLLALIFCFSAAHAVPIHLERQQTTAAGTSLFVLGDIPQLGGNNVVQALKLSPTSYPNWFVNLDLPAGTTFQYRFLTRLDGAADIGNPANGTFLDATPIAFTVPGVAASLRSGVLHYYSGAAAPVLEILQPDAGYRRIALQRAGAGRSGSENLWAAALDGLPAGGDWQFRIDLGGGSYDKPADAAHYQTALAVAWLQDGQLFNYAPPPTVSAPRVVKVASFAGTLSTRPIYVYIPRGYDQNTDKRYPLIYMHDGQACFQAYPESAFGTWAADTMATRLIRQGRMRECLIVAVGNSNDRLTEYLPPYDSLVIFPGTANQTATYYQGSVASYMAANYRVLPGRENTATCGSSMGGFFSTYLAWEFPQFARHHAALSPAYWITKEGSGTMEVVERLRTGSPVRDIRLYIDSGMQDGNPRGSVSTIPDDDGMSEAYAARDALLQNGYKLGDDFQRFVSVNGIHNEGSWAARLDKPFLFLFSISQEPTATPQFIAAGPSWQIN